MTLRSLPHDIAIFAVSPRLRTPIFETLENPSYGEGGMKNTVFLQGAQKVDFYTFFLIHATHNTQHAKHTEHTTHIHYIGL